MFGVLPSPPFKILIPAIVHILLALLTKLKFSRKIADSHGHNSGNIILLDFFPNAFNIPNLIITHQV